MITLRSVILRQSTKSALALDVTRGYTRLCVHYTVGCVGVWCDVLGDTVVRCYSLSRR